jgi:hypothetical protein
MAGTIRHATPVAAMLGTIATALAVEIRAEGKPVRGIASTASAPTV